MRQPETTPTSRELTEGQGFKPFEDLPAEDIPETYESAQWIWPSIGKVRFKFSRENVPLAREDHPNPRIVEVFTKLNEEGEKARWQKRIRFTIMDPNGDKYESDVPDYSDGKLHSIFPDRELPRDEETGHWQNRPFLAEDMPEIIVTATQSWVIPGGKLS